jgi:hypothetical protein
VTLSLTCQPSLCCKQRLLGSPYPSPSTALLSSTSRATTSRIGKDGKTLQSYYDIFGTVEEVEVSAESTILLTDPALNLDSDALFLDWWRQVQALFQPTLPH